MNPIVPLFSYPVMFGADKYQFSQAEETFISELPMASNLGNQMSVNDRVLASEELKGLKDYIDHHIEDYTTKILRLGKKNEIYITQSWANKSLVNEYHPIHRHPNSMLSGVLFVSGQQGDGLPPIRFHRSNELLPLDLAFEELNEFNTSTRWFSPERGLLILFPSVLLHDVAHNQSDQERTSISFNTFVKGPLGKKAQLTEVV